MLKLKTIFVRKAINYNQVLNDQKQMIKDLHTHVEEFDIESVVESSHAEFEEFKNNLLCERDFIKEHDDIFLVKEKGTDDYSGLIIDALGFDYPRFVGIPMKEVDVKKCPKCSKMYFGHPAISRTDNKLEICPECGVAEALEDYSINSEFLKMLSHLQDGADRFNAKIIIKREGHEDIIIEPKNEEPVTIQT